MAHVALRNGEKLHYDLLLVGAAVVSALCKSCLIRRSLNYVV